MTRTRNYACVAYPESVPDNWVDIIKESHIPCFISPLHDSDINPTGEKKKPHYHVIACYDSVKTIEQAREFFQSFGGVGCEIVNSMRGYARYLCHLDNPEKHQYSINDVQSLGGLDYIYTIGTSSDKMKTVREIVEYIESNDISSFSELFLFSSVNRSDWFDCLCNHCTFIVREYIRSRNMKLHHKNEY